MIQKEQKMSVMRLETIYLDQVEFKLNTAPTPGIENAPELSISLGVNSEYDSKERSSRVVVSVSIPREPESSEPPFTLKVSFAGIFKFGENFPTEQIEYFQKVNCPAIIFPYLRETVADVVRRAGLPPLHLPPFNFVAMYKKGNEKPQKKIPKKRNKKIPEYTH
jgi:preprotein translocase subunit SecB